ncbi:ClpP/crotonase [Violaceomyces palustris]|uniref:ClpP/crotonase n=1 Tax=Violaceomyces palustris TaxID=1673888 RepID=A0ACD0P095_9BASI|nr:ClpP/crotonase [Violaceomyces palustris]
MALVHLERDSTNRTIYHLVLDRGQARNAINRKLLQDLDRSLDQLVEVSSLGMVTCVVLRSKDERCFCSGADLKERSTMSRLQALDFLNALRECLDRLDKLPVPTIAAIDGLALGGGLELALACDFRVASREVNMLGFPEVRLGIIPGAGGTQRAPRIIGMQKAKELIYTGKVVSAIEAHGWGLIDYLSAIDQSATSRALELATNMMSSAPLALKSAKMAISEGFDLELERGLQWEIQCYEPLLLTRDRLEALEAFKQKRKPIFQGC